MNATIVIKVPTMKISSRKPMPNPNCPGYSARNGFKLVALPQIYTINVMLVSIRRGFNLSYCQMSFTPEIICCLLDENLRQFEIDQSAIVIYARNRIWLLPAVAQPGRASDPGSNRVKGRRCRDLGS